MQELTINQHNDFIEVQPYPNPLLKGLFRSFSPLSWFCTLGNQLAFYNEDLSLLTTYKSIYTRPLSLLIDLQALQVM